MKLIRELLEGRVKPSSEWKAALIATTKRAIADAKSIKGKMVGNVEITEVTIDDMQELLDPEDYNKETSVPNSVQKKVGVFVKFSNGKQIELHGTVDSPVRGSNEFTFNYYTAFTKNKSTRNSFHPKHAYEGVVEAYNYLFGKMGLASHSKVDSFLDALDHNHSDTEIDVRSDEVHFWSYRIDDELDVPYKKKNDIIKIALHLLKHGNGDSDLEDCLEIIEYAHGNGYDSELDAIKKSLSSKGKIK